MTQAASSPPPHGGGAPPAEGQAGGAGDELALEKRREEIKKIRERMLELHVKLLKAKENNVDVSKQYSVLSWLETKLQLISMYYKLLRIEQHVRAGQIDSYMRNTLREIVVNLSVDDIDDPLFYAVRDKAQRIQKLADASSELGGLEAQLDEIAKAIRRLEKEVLRQEGWDVD